MANFFNAFFQSLGNALKENPEGQTSVQETQVSMATKDRLIDDLVRVLSDLLEGANDIDRKQLVIWIDTDQLTFDSYDSDTYHARLEDALANECGFCFSKIRMTCGSPAAADRATAIGDSGKVFIRVITPDEVQPRAVSRRATISILGDNGSLLQSKYILSSDQMKQQGITAYNIGAGRSPKLPTGYRENHIAIDDNPASPMVERNKYVSRSHAHIGFSDQFGFYLQVEKDGTRLMGKRTRIFRGDEKIECDNPQVKVPLQSGDQIELGKAVVLNFIENNQQNG